MSLGADIIGLNCLYSPVTALKAIKKLKEALEEEGLSSHIMMQPSGYRTDDLNNRPIIEAPECPLGKNILEWKLNDTKQHFPLLLQYFSTSIYENIEFYLVSM